MGRTRKKSDGMDFDRLSQSSGSQESEYDHVEDCLQNEIVNLKHELAKVNNEKERLQQSLIKMKSAFAGCILLTITVAFIAPLASVQHLSSSEARTAALPEPAKNMPQLLDDSCLFTSPNIGELREITVAWNQPGHAFNILDRYISWVLPIKSMWPVKRPLLINGSLEVGDEIVSVDGVYLNDKHEPEIRELIGYREVVTVVVRRNRFAFHAIQQAYDKGWEKSRDREFSFFTFVIGFYFVIIGIGYLIPNRCLEEKFLATSKEETDGKITSGKYPNEQDGKNATESGTSDSWFSNCGSCKLRFYLIPIACMFAFFTTIFVRISSGTPSDPGKWTRVSK